MCLQGMWVKRKRSVRIVVCGYQMSLPIPLRNRRVTIYVCYAKKMFIKIQRSDFKISLRILQHGDEKHILMIKVETI